MEGSKKTLRSSNNDQPLAETYITIEFINSEEVKDTYYLYESNGSYYLEKPYEGIYKANSNTYDTIVEKFNQW